MNYTKTLLGPIYRVQGVDGVLTIRGAAYSPVRVMDKSAGISLSAAGPVEIETVRPAAAIRVDDLSVLGISIDDLDRQSLTMNGRDFLITSVKPISSPNGDADGEVYLYLEVQ